MITLPAIKNSKQSEVRRPSLGLVLPARETLAEKRARLSDDMVKNSQPGTADYARRLDELVVLTVRIQKG